MIIHDVRWDTNETYRKPKPGDIIFKNEFVESAAEFCVGYYLLGEEDEFEDCSEYDKDQWMSEKLLQGFGDWLLENNIDNDPQNWSESDRVLFELRWG